MAPDRRLLDHLHLFVYQLGLFLCLMIHVHDLLPNVLVLLADLLLRGLVQTHTLRLRPVGLSQARFLSIQAFWELLQLLPLERRDFF